MKRYRHRERHSMYGSDIVGNLFVIGVFLIHAVHMRSDVRATVCNFAERDGSGTVDGFAFHKIPTATVPFFQCECEKSEIVFRYRCCLTQYFLDLRRPVDFGVVINIFRVLTQSVAVLRKGDVVRRRVLFDSSWNTCFNIAIIAFFQPGRRRLLLC